MGGTPNYPAEGGSLTPTGPAALTAGRGTVFRGRVQPVVQRGIRGTPFRGRGRGFEAGKAQKHPYPMIDPEYFSASNRTSSCFTSTSKRAYRPTEPT